MYVLLCSFPLRGIPQDICGPWLYNVHELFNYCNGKLVKLLEPPHAACDQRFHSGGGSHFPRNVGSHQNFHFQRWINFLTHSSKMTKKLFSKYIPKNEDYCSTILGWCFVSIWNVSHLHTNVIILHGCGWHPYLGLCSKVQITSKPSCQRVVLININWRLHIICLIDIVKIYC